jgi:hypothetical protein
MSVLSSYIEINPTLLQKSIASLLFKFFYSILLLQNDTNYDL